MGKPDIHRLLELQDMLLTFSQIERVVDRKQAHNLVKENDTEHSYNLALTAWFLAKHFSDLDRDKLIRLALAHDILEVHAGDTYIYGSKELLDSKSAREAEAIKKLEQEWADFPELLDLIKDYESKTSKESKFIYALDKIMPIMLIYLNNGYTWKQEGIDREMLDAVKRDKVAVSPEIAPYYQQLYKLLESRPELFR